MKRPPPLPHPSAQQEGPERMVGETDPRRPPDSGAPWRERMAAAQAACDRLVADRRSGEALFRALLAQYPRDGMLYFKRAEAYELAGDIPAALKDYTASEPLLTRVSWMHRARAARSRIQATLRRPPPPKVTEQSAPQLPAGEHRYGPLTSWLRSRTYPLVRCTFLEIGSVLESPLPAEAYKYRAWWANSRSPQGTSWREAGYSVTTVDLRGERVTFSRQLREGMAALPSGNAQFGAADRLT